MNSLEKFFVLIKYKFSKLNIILRLLIIVVIMSLIGAAIAWKCGAFVTVGMTEQEKAEYIQTKEEAAAAAQAIADSEALVATETSNNYKRFDSPNLNATETAVVNYIHACASKDYQQVADALAIPNVFGDSNFEEWMDTTGIRGFLGKTDEECAVSVYKEDVVDSRDEVTGTVDVADVWYSGAASKYRFTLTENKGALVLTPLNGVKMNSIYVLPVKDAESNGTNLSEFMTGAVNCPYSVNVAVEKDAPWYSFSFPRFADVSQPVFVLKTQIGDYEGTVSETSTTSKGVSTNIVIANFTDDEIRNFSDSAATAVWNAIQAIQNEASDKDIANYLAVSSVLESISPSDEKAKEKTFESICSIGGVEVYRDERIDGEVPLSFNYHLTGDNTVSMKVDVRFSLVDNGECRRCDTILLRKIENRWTVVGMGESSAENMFTRINMLDPEW